jgi:hypothetical protein
MMLATVIEIDPTLSLGDLIVGVGTLLLAFVTWTLAKSTAASVEAMDLPFLVATSEREGAFNLQAIDPGDENTDVEWAFSVELTNLGSGPAILDGLDLRTVDHGEQLLKRGWRIDRPILPNEKLRIGIPLQIDAGVDEFSPFILEVFYRSSSGVRYATAHEMTQATHMGAQRRKFARRRIGRRQLIPRWGRSRSR